MNVLVKGIFITLFTRKDQRVGGTGEEGDAWDRVLERDGMYVDSVKDSSRMGELDGEEVMGAVW